MRAAPAGYIDWISGDGKTASRYFCLYVFVSFIFLLRGKNVFASFFPVSFVGRHSYMEVRGRVHSYSWSRLFSLMLKHNLQEKR